jgi:hypothetical protein
LLPLIPQLCVLPHSFVLWCGLLLPLLG